MIFIGLFLSYTKIGKAMRAVRDSNELANISGINSDNIIMVKSEDLFSNPQTYNKICAFLGHHQLSERKITSIIKKPVNKQKQSAYPKWTEWSEEDKTSLIKMTPLGVTYGYWK